MRPTRKMKRKSRNKKMKGGNTKLFTKTYCSPNPNKSQKKDYTCFDDTSLIKLRDLWNLRHTDSKIVAKDSKSIWEELKRKLSNVCSKESCWLKQQFTQDKFHKELDTLFAPKMPEEWKKNINEWLSSVDIENVMKQYERAYKCFEFIGPSPIDFDTLKSGSECVWPELCDLNIQTQMASGKTKIGIIFNTDKHTGGGIHWISLFINIKKREIFFYDSAGEMPPKEVQVLIERIKEQGKQLNSPIQFASDYNYPKEHQMSSTECGIYSLYFIVHMLEDHLTGHYLKNHVIKDKFVEKFRKIYFNEDLL
jgi:hypothetical protein